ncbi:MAG TPA: hypothetical protein VFJ66_04885 [Gaiellales bacterium]|nr:hypothetical protein [Gaiellales bacterium]
MESSGTPEQHRKRPAGERLILDEVTDQLSTTLQLLSGDPDERQRGRSPRSGSTRTPRPRC